MQIDFTGTTGLAGKGGEWWRRGCGNTLRKKSPQLNPSVVQTSFFLTDCINGAHCLYPPPAPVAGEFFSGFLSCSAVREKQSEVEDIAPGKKNQKICTESLFFCSLAVTLALCLNSQKVSFLICQIIIKSTSYPGGSFNDA